MHYICPECEQQNIAFTSAYWDASAQAARDWVFACNECGWEGTTERGFWGTDGRWNRRSGIFNR